MPEQYIVIIGCGSLGAALGNELSRMGHSIVMIDRNESAFKSLSDGFSGFMVLGDANEYFVLRQAQIEKANIVLAVTDDDNLNVMLSQISQKIYHIPQVLARVNNPGSSEIFAKMGIRTICPNLLAVDRFLEMLNGMGGDQ